MRNRIDEAFLLDERARKLGCVAHDSYSLDVVYEDSVEEIREHLPLRCHRDGIPSGGFIWKSGARSRWATREEREKMCGCASFDPAKETIPTRDAFRATFDSLKLSAAQWA